MRKGHGAAGTGERRADRCTNLTGGRVGDWLNPPRHGNTIDRQPVSASDFASIYPGKRYRVIEVIHNELITSRSSVYSENGLIAMMCCAVLERYG